MTFCTDPQTLRARKQHRCTWCGEAIASGSMYARWVSFDDSAFTSKMHEECRVACNAMLSDLGENEYEPFEGVRGGVRHGTLTAGEPT